MARHGIPTARLSRRFTDAADAHAYVDAATARPSSSRPTGWPRAKAWSWPRRAGEAHAAIDA